MAASAFPVQAVMRTLMIQFMTEPEVRTVERGRWVASLFQPSNAIAAPMLINGNQRLAPTIEKPGVDVVPMATFRHRRSLFRRFDIPSWWEKNKSGLKVSRKVHFEGSTLHF